MKRSYNAREIGTDAAKIIGVDVARFGDDESALAFRQGIQAFPLYLPSFDFAAKPTPVGDRPSRLSPSIQPEPNPLVSSTKQACAPKSPQARATMQAPWQTTYTFQGDKLLLEPKADLKARIGFSPDEFDALILTFAHPVTVSDYQPRYRQLQVEYNPYREPDPYRASSHTYDYNPYE